MFFVYYFVAMDHHEPATIVSLASSRCEDKIQPLLVHDWKYFEIIVLQNRAKTIKSRSIFSDTENRFTALVDWLILSKIEDRRLTSAASNEKNSIEEIALSD